MYRINPIFFQGPRAYFTAIDPKIVKRTKDKFLLRKNIERRLKILLLLKTRLICAASHLTSEFSYQLFKDYPELLNQELIIPALRTDKESIEHLFTEKRFKNKKDKINFYNENVISTVKWELKENSEWFQNQFIKELENENSLIRKNLSDVSLPIINNLITSVKKQDVLSREFIENISSSLPTRSKTILYNYRDLVYHLSGARVVNCESSLPQENYVDFDLVDLSQKRTRLSDEQIMLKIFLELAFETFQKKMIPIEYVDHLNFSDIIEIRKPIIESDFQAQYDQIIKNVCNAIQGKYDIFLLNINELMRIRSELESTFTRIFEKELPVYIKKKASKDFKQLGNISSSVALGVLGFIPIVGYISSALSVLKDTPALIFNLNQTFHSIKSLNNFKRYHEQKQNIIKSKIKRTQISEKSIMLDMVDFLMSIISEKIKF